MNRGLPASKAKTQLYAEAISQSPLRSHLNIHYKTGSGTGGDPEERNSGVGGMGRFGTRAQKG